jgi:hypothetical protein
LNILYHKRKHVELHKKYDPMALMLAGGAALSGAGALYTKEPQHAALAAVYLGNSAYVDLTIPERANTESLYRNIASKLNGEGEEEGIKAVEDELEQD